MLQTYLSKDLPNGRQYSQLVPALLLCFTYPYIDIHTCIHMYNLSNLYIPDRVSLTLLACQSYHVCSTWDLTSVARAQHYIKWSVLGSNNFLNIVASGNSPNAA